MYEKTRHMTSPTKIYKNSLINQFNVVQWKYIHLHETHYANQWKHIHLHETHYAKDIFKNNSKELLSRTFACRTFAHHFNKKVNC